MSAFLNIKWKDILFPIVRDIIEINKETDTGRISKNNLELATNDDTFKKVLQEINDKKRKAFDKETGK